MLRSIRPKRASYPDLAHKKAHVGQVVLVVYSRVREGTLG
jgi:hypothetical protein